MWEQIRQMTHKKCSQKEQFDGTNQCLSYWMKSTFLTFFRTEQWPKGPSKFFLIELNVDISH